jgi:hypothetical protein
MADTARVGVVGSGTPSSYACSVSDTWSGRRLPDPMRLGQLLTTRRFAAEALPDIMRS